MRLPCILLLLLLTASAKADPIPSLRADWEALLSSGCDVRARHVHTTIEAVALRNAPYALKGYVFKSAALTRLFEADGGWYRPDPKAGEPQLSTEETACIKRLKQREAELGAVIPKELEAQFLGERAEVLSLRNHTRLMGRGPVKLRRYGKSVELTCARCKELRTVQLHCEPDACHLLVPGA